MLTFTSVTKEDLERLSFEEGVNLIRSLLWAEATSLGIPKNKINVPMNTTAPDGGIDATVDCSGFSGGQGIIKEGKTYYQIKTGNFNISQKSNISKVIFKEQTRDLLPRVKSCLDDGGTFVVICLGWDNPEQVDNQIITNFHEQLKDYYKCPKIEVWGQSKVIGFLEPFPSLASEVNGRSQVSFLNQVSWSKQEDMKKKFEEDEEKTATIKQIQDVLRNNTEAIHICVTGEPGIGKTKLVFEALKDEDLKPLVLYFDSSERFMDRMLNILATDDNTFETILVVDECGSEDSAIIWRKIKHLGKRIRFISINNETADYSDITRRVEIQPLDKDGLLKIIGSYGTPPDQAHRWVEYCGGSPRVAHVIGLNLKFNPEDVLKPDSSNLWQRYIVGSDNKDSNEVAERRIVLRYISLFRRFGFKETYSAEGKAIAKYIEKNHPNITLNQFNSIIYILRNIKILQGNTTLYITPKALHVWLWREWWVNYGNNIDVYELCIDLPEKLQEWFFEMFEYAEDDESQRIVRELLGPEGPYNRADYIKTKRGGRYFLALTPANPKLALDCLERTIGTWSKEELLLFTEGRREVIWALQKISVWNDLFSGSAKLLLQLAEAENESWANNASGVFSELFSLAPGKVAPTEAAPLKRFPILQDGIKSNSVDRRFLIINACDEALEAHHFTKNIDSEYQGLRKEPQLWMPATYDEWYTEYRRIWQFLECLHGTLTPEENKRIIDILCNRSRGLLGISSLSEMVISTLEKLSRNETLDKKTILETVSSIVHYDSKTLPKATIDRLNSIQNAIIGNDYRSRMKRYVGMILLEDMFDDREGKSSKFNQKIKELAFESLSNSELLSAELSWVVTDEAKNGYLFGYELGQLDTNLSIIQEIFTQIKSDAKPNNCIFAGGYLRALFERDKDGRDAFLDELSQDEKLRRYVPILTWRSGISDRAGLRVLSLMKDGRAEWDQLGLFNMGAVVCGLSEEVFHKWIEFLLQKEGALASSIAINLFSFYYTGNDEKNGKKMPMDITYRVLSHTGFFDVKANHNPNNLDEYCWGKVAHEYISDHPQMASNIATIILEHFGLNNTIFSYPYHEIQKILKEVMGQHSRETWNLIFKILAPPYNLRSYSLSRWLRGDELENNESQPPLSSVPQDMLWDWVEEDKNSRASYLASFVPNSLTNFNSNIGLARELLIRYGGDSSVRENLFANFSSEFFWGVESEHIEKKMRKLELVKVEEKNEIVIQWIDEFITLLNTRLDGAKTREEREG